MTSGKAGGLLGEPLKGTDKTTMITPLHIFNVICKAFHRYCVGGATEGGYRRIRL